MQMDDSSQNAFHYDRLILNNKQRLRRRIVNIVLYLCLLIPAGGSTSCGDNSIEFHYRVLAASDSFCPPFQGICWSFVLPGTPGAPPGVTAVKSDNLFGSHGTIYLIKIATIYNKSNKPFKFDPRNLYISDPKYNLTWIPENQLAQVTHLLTPIEIAGLADENAEPKVKLNGLVLIAAPTKWTSEDNSGAPQISYRKQPFEPDQDQTFSFFVLGPYGDQPRYTEMLNANGDTEFLLNKGLNEKP